MTDRRSDSSRIRTAGEAQDEMMRDRCPDCGGGRADRRLVYMFGKDLDGVRCENEEWHRCPTCGSDDPRVRKECIPAIMDDYWWHCDNDAFHAPRKEADDGA